MEPNGLDPDKKGKASRWLVQEQGLTSRVKAEALGLLAAEGRHVERALSEHGASLRNRRFVVQPAQVDEGDLIATVTGKLVEEFRDRYRERNPWKNMDEVDSELEIVEIVQAVVTAVWQVDRDEMLGEG